MRLSQRESKKNNIILPAFAVFSFGLHLIGLMLLLFHGSMLKQLKRQFIPQSLVQLADGRTITVDSQQNLERHPETIRRFVAETISFMLTHSEKQSQEIIWKIGSELLAKELRLKSPEKVLSFNPSQKFLDGERITETVLVIQKISQPKKIEDGKWKVQIVAHQLIFTDYNRLGKAIAINKQISVRAVNRPAFSLSKKPLPERLHLTASQIGEARLQVYHICDMQAANCVF